MSPTQSCGGEETSLKDYALAQLKKKLRSRVVWLFFIIVIYLLGDERIKEGYYFDPSDITNPLSHEFWIIVFSVLTVVSLLNVVARRMLKNSQE